MAPETPSRALSADTAPTSIRAYCLRILSSGDLASKLAPALQPGGSPLSDEVPGPALSVDRPTRGPGLAMGEGGDALPRPGQLKEAGHRVTCLKRFAHHELMAVEYFAWALLRWPELPPALRRAWLGALVDEQRHCRLYLKRLERHGGDFMTDDHSDYFWRQAPAIIASDAGPRAFLSVMGLTLEQANLDFTLTYRDAFAEAGDAESARVCQTVHDEEIPHVALAVRWLERLDPDSDSKERSDLDRYLEAVPFPMGPARAKGRRFEVSARRKAGLSEEMIEHVRHARSTQETGRLKEPTTS